jgi:hypothetical protein
LLIPVLTLIMHATDSLLLFRVVTSPINALSSWGGCSSQSEMSNGGCGEFDVVVDFALFVVTAVCFSGACARLFDLAIRAETERFRLASSSGVLLGIGTSCGTALLFSTLFPFLVWV